MKRFAHIAAAFIAVYAAVSCTFSNDMSYPRLQGQITAFAVEGQKSVSINAEAQTVDVLLEETADITRLEVTEYAISEKTVADKEIGPVIDLSDPVVLMLDTYPGQSYEWTISASQPIDRYVNCTGLIEAEFDSEHLTAIVYVTERQPLEEIIIESMKLGPETSLIISTTGYDSSTSGEVTIGVEFPMTLDCTLSRKFTVLYDGEETVWTLTFVQKKISNEIKYVDAWTYHAVVAGEFDGEGQPYYEYRQAIDNDWIRFDGVEVNGVSVVADIPSLEAATDYVVRLVSGETVGTEYEFSTESPNQLKGMDFDSWYYGGKNGKTWYPYAESDSSPVWDTANPGVSSLIENTTVPEYDHKVEGDAAVKMVSDLALIKFAAGNIFTGKFVEFKDWTATLEWGVPFTSRPYSLKGYYDYKPGIINRDEMGQFPDLVGKPDIMQIMVALLAEGEGNDVGPLPILSNEPENHDLRKNPRVIAYAELLSSEDTGGEYVEFDLPLVYNEGDTRKPAYAIVIACASYRGNFFTGAVGSTMYVDDFQFTYR